MTRATCCSTSAAPRTTRRAFLASASVAGLVSTFGARGASPSRAAATDHVDDRPHLPALEAFDLADVTLHDGPFLEAQRRTEAYLLSLDPDRLLHGFVVNAGLQPTAPVYGGWESDPTWADIHCQGHTLGHYLSACALMYRSTGDERFKQRVDHVVNTLAACQQAGGTGLICAFPEGPSLVAAHIAGEKITGVPRYTLHKVYAGLRDAHRLCDSELAGSVLTRLADWAVIATRPLSDQQFEAMLETEHGGMNEIFADLFLVTGNAEYLTLARRFSHKAILGPLAKSHDHLDGLHANTQIPKVVGFSRIYDAGGEPAYRDAATFFWRTVATTRSYATGGHGDEEHFFAVADVAKHVFSAKGSETCGLHNMLKLTRALFLRDPQADYADFYERGLFNGILGSQDPATGMVTYFQGARPGYMKLYCTPTDSFWCCTGTGMENHAKYRDSIYFRDAKTLYVNLFIPSSVTWAKNDAILTQTTSFPEDPSTKLRWNLSRPLALILKLRHPGWSRSASVRINGELAAKSVRAGSYVEISRTWHDGDTIELTLSMHVEAEALLGAPEIVAFTYGPLVLAGALGTDGLVPGADIVVNERKYGSYNNSPFSPPRLAGNAAELARQVRAGHEPLAFALSSSDRRDIRLKPYYQIAHERYATYWKLEPASS